MEAAVLKHFDALQRGAVTSRHEDLAHDGCQLGDRFEDISSDIPDPVIDHGIELRKSLSLAEGEDAPAAGGADLEIEELAARSSKAEPADASDSVEDVKSDTTLVPRPYLAAGAAGSQRVSRQAYDQPGSGDLQQEHVSFDREGVSYTSRGALGLPAPPSARRSSKTRDRPQRGWTAFAGQGFSLGLQHAAGLAEPRLWTEAMTTPGSAESILATVLYADFHSRTKSPHPDGKEVRGGQGAGPPMATPQADQPLSQDTESGWI